MLSLLTRCTLGRSEQEVLSALFSSGRYRSLSSARTRIEDMMILDEGYFVAAKVITSFNFSLH